MLELQFDKMKCFSCKTYDCLLECQYLGLDKDKAKAEIEKIINGEDSLVLHHCATCYACEEYCKRGNHPFYLIVERQEQMGIVTTPRAITNQWVNMCQPTGRFTTGKVTERALSFCFMPALRDLVRGRLFEDTASSYVFGADFFCNVVYLHFATSSVTKDRLPKIVENIRRQGIKELICLHDECYGSFNSLAPAYGIEVPFKPVHYLEYLYNKLREYKNKIKPVHIKAAYQRNCSARLAPETDHFVDNIFQLIGVERVRREYDREKALCCGEVMRMVKGYKLADDVQKRNIDDMVKAGAEYCVFNCPACWDALAGKVAKKGIKPIHMIDLCKLAILEKPTVEV